MHLDGQWIAQHRAERIERRERPAKRSAMNRGFHRSERQNRSETNSIF
jgi:hypothetical protein